MQIKVLLADDEREFVDSLADRLETRGFLVRKAYNGFEAVALMKAEPSDVVVLDILMPGKDGVETLREIKQIAPHAEVIMLTGYGTMSTAIDGLKFGAFDYLFKPCDTSDLITKIKQAYGSQAKH